ncbi:MAG TPA: site-specific integrase [Ktedonobacteraceae bacterium]|nr:site-specific integrase [Ktedonobacteraceae bacterium]
MTDQPQEQKRPRKTRGRGRSRGEGSVFKRSGERKKPWVAQITQDGKKTVVGYYKTEAEAITARNKALRDVEQGTWVANSKQTVGEYLNYWLEHVHKPRVGETSYQDYRYALDARIIPALGHIQMQKLTMHQVQMFYSKLTDKEELGARRVHMLHSLLHGALAHAVRENLLARNVCEGVQLPRLDERERPALTPEQAMQMLASVQDSQLRMIVQLAVVTGLRRGELCALKWQDVDFAKRYLHIRRNLVRLKGQGLVEKSPKTKRSRRDISLPLFVVDALKQHQAHQQEVRQAAGDSWQEHDLVFCKKDGTHIHVNTLDRWFKKLLESANLPPEMHLHDLRHSMVTILLQMGIPAHVVQEIAGHSDVKTTLGVYAHVLPGQQENAMEKWDKVFRVEGEERHAKLQQQWEGCSAEVQEHLAELLKRYGEGAVQIAMDIITLLQ